MKIRSFFYLLCLVVTITLTSCFDRDKYAPKPYERALEIVKLSDNEFLHISYLKDGRGGYIPCNGYIYANSNEALIFDTPINDTLTDQLISFINNELKFSIKGAVLNHSHRDASGGVKFLNRNRIPTYGSIKTAEILAKDSLFITHPFETKQEIVLGDTTVENTYFGEAHTVDNIVSYIHKTNTVVGGCMIKSLNSQKGNLRDANLLTWSKTVSKVKDTYPDVSFVIPGHGAAGDATLLDYTVNLFSTDSGQESAVSNLE